MSGVTTKSARDLFNEFTSASSRVSSDMVKYRLLGESIVGYENTDGGKFMKEVFKPLGDEIRRRLHAFEAITGDALWETMKTTVVETSPDNPHMAIHLAQLNAAVKALKDGK